jgi:hypothetical protein
LAFFFMGIPRPVPASLNQPLRVSFTHDPGRKPVSALR